MSQRKTLDARKLTFMAMLAAMSILLVMLVRISVIPAAPFLEYDPADIPVLIGAFLFGPWYGLILTVVVSVLQGLTFSAASGPIGILMHIFATGIMAIVAGSIYRRGKTLKSALIALIAASVAMVASMIAWNILLTPVFMGVERSVVIEMIVPVFLPFNLIKTGLNGVVTFLVYKPISNLYRFDQPKAADSKVL